MEKFEQGLNQMLREQAEHEASIFKLNCVWQVLGLQASKKMGKKEVTQELFKATSLLTTFQQTTSDPNRVREATNMFISVYEGFLQQHAFKTLHEYLYEKKFRQRTIYQIKFYLSLGPGFDKQTLFQKLKVFCHFENAITLENAQDKFETLPVHQWGMYMQDVVQELAVEHFGLESAFWKPSEPFEVLCKLLKEVGPLCFCGKLGFIFYEQSPQKLSETWGQREVHGWPPGSKRNEPVTIHAVLVIGAAKNCVYFLDPQYPSDPAHPLLEPILKISYANLQKNAYPFFVYFKGQKSGLPSAYALQRKVIKNASKMLEIK